MKGTKRFGIKGKLAPCFFGPFEVIGKIGDLAYQLELPSNFSNVRDVFHVSQIRRCFKTPERIVDLKDIDLQPDLSYHEHPIAILEETECKTAAGYAYRDFLGKYAKDSPAALEPCVGVPLKRKG
ncbi:hypothetical protein ZWY2020_048408 [Hordeum vulgare]|nr:hypothetical protein ZWY2020_048408 [Hordeum vulgare]